MTSDRRSDIDPVELQRRVVHALLGPVVRVADTFGLPLGELLGWVKMAYFEALRARGLKLREIAQRLEISERNAKRLAREHRTNFAHGRDYALPVRIEFMLWATPMSRAKVKQVLPDDPAAVDEAIDTLLAEQRVILEPGRTPTLVVNRAVDDLVRDTWLTRIGGLNSFLGNLADAVFGRFFKGEPRTFARTLNFLIERQDLPELEALFATGVLERIRVLDERAQAAGDGQSFRLSICWAPYRFLADHRDEDTTRGETT